MHVPEMDQKCSGWYFLDVILALEFFESLLQDFNGVDVRPINKSYGSFKWFVALWYFPVHNFLGVLAEEDFWDNSAICHLYCYEGVFTIKVEL